MKKKLGITFLFVLIHLSCVKFVNAQTKMAKNLTDVESINKILNTKLVYDTKSIQNKSGKFDCVYTDTNVPGRKVSIGLIEAKIQYGSDLLTMDFKENQKRISEGKKAIGKYDKFYLYPKAGSNSFYMTGSKDNYSDEAFTFKFRQGNYIVTFYTSDIPVNKVIEKVDEIYKILSLQL